MITDQSSSSYSTPAPATSSSDSSQALLASDGTSHLNYFGRTHQAVTPGENWSMPLRQMLAPSFDSTRSYLIAQGPHGPFACYPSPASYADVLFPSHPLDFTYCTYHNENGYSSISEETAFINSPLLTEEEISSLRLAHVTNRLSETLISYQRFCEQPGPFSLFTWDVACANFQACNTSRDNPEDCNVKEEDKCLENVVLGNTSRDNAEDRNAKEEDEGLEKVVLGDTSRDNAEDCDFKEEHEGLENEVLGNASTDKAEGCNVAEKDEGLEKDLLSSLDAIFEDHSEDKTGKDDADLPERSPGIEDI